MTDIVQFISKEALVRAKIIEYWQKEYDADPTEQDLRREVERMEQCSQAPKDSYFPLCQDLWDFVKPVYQDG